MKNLDEILKTQKLFNQKLRELTLCIESMPKAKFIDTPTTDFAKYRAWLHSSEPALRAEATSWAKSRIDDLDIDYDGNGSIIDFTEVDF